ncbi:UNVERIFIED_CONTAM: hypothetical protein Sangu_2898400 [Sesamum angustifolium]|uniref:Gag-pol polyprotein n=1 Tax=Sesamum angustifolium TaxID=2727405 RepID=A0AAW2IN81_9LAMI
MWYRCDEPYVPGHRCKYRQVYMLLNEEETKEYDKAEQGEQPAEEEGNESDVNVSVYAMKGSISNKTLKISGLVADKEILILIDCGSTHCFINEKVVMALGCKLEGTTPMVIRVADGSQIISQMMCPGFS